MPPKKAAAAQPAGRKSTREKASAKSTTAASKVVKPASKVAGKKAVAKKAASIVSSAKSAASKKSDSVDAPKKSGRPASGKSAVSAAQPVKANTTKKRKSPHDEDDAPAVNKRVKKAETPATAKAATKATGKKVVAKKAAPKTTKRTASKKAAIEDDEDEEPEDKPKTKPVHKKPAAPKKVAPSKPAKPAKVLPEINKVPTVILDAFVFGEGSAGELGLGAKSSDGKKVVDVTRPRLNERLSAKDVGVVLIAVGGMHCAALTKDNKILTWGVNDQGALGRPTGEGAMKEIKENANSDSGSDSDDDDSDLNPTEAEPREVDLSHFPEGTKFAALFAGDSSTFALTTTGLVYGWGTFRANDGVLGFRQDIKIQTTPMLIPELKNIVSMATGTNHVLALDTKGKVFTWGAGEQHQLARRVVQRTATGGLVPREFGLSRKSIVYVGGGDYHSFAVDKKGDVYSWGLNTFGQTGIPKDEGIDENTVATPTLVKSLKDYEIDQIAGGAHHTLAKTKTGEVLIWGRIDTNQGGMKIADMPKEAVFFDEHEKGRYLKKPIQVKGIKGTYVATGNDTCVVIDQDGKAWSWGFSSNYQTGQGTDQDVVEAKVIDNTAVRGKKLIWAGVGGQFGLVGGQADV